jgi:hypothetical protein
MDAPEIASRRRETRKRPMEKPAFLSERNLTGNAIDFCVQVLNLSFHDAMRQILRS